MAASLQVGFLGAGYIADWHANALRNVPRVELVAVCDQNAQRARRFAARFAVPATYTDLNAMLEAKRLDAIHVLVPPDQHFAAARRSLEAGVHVLLEKPMCIAEAECSDLMEQAKRQRCALGVSHNFLHSPIYRQLKDDLGRGQLGRLENLTITWSKELPQLRAGPYGSWVLQDPGNIILEAGVHSVAHLLDLVGFPDSIEARADAPVELPNGVRFHRRWLVRAIKGAACVDLHFNFGSSFAEQTIQVRGSAGSACVDFENDIYTLRRHRRLAPDFDRYERLVREARGLKSQARGNLARYCLSKFHLSGRGNAFGYSITRALASFYSQLPDELDSGLNAEFGRAVVRACNAICAAAGLEVSTHKKQEAVVPQRSQATPRVLVLGGTGFIGRYLVEHLLNEGEGVRLLVRDLWKVPHAIREAGAEIVCGDADNLGDLERSLEGVRFVYHLARSSASTWSEYQEHDLEVIRRVAQACLQSRAEALYYTSTLACYYSGRPGTIDEQTPLDPRMERRNLYTRSKAASEQILLDLHRTSALPVVIFRPGIVIGRGASPFHWGVGFWAWDSVCRLWGEGRNSLPIVLVDDVARALAQARKIPGLAGQSFNLAGECRLSGRDYVEELEKALATRIEVIPTPAWKLFSLDCLKWLVKWLVRHPERGLPSYRDWKARSFLSLVDNSKAKKVLGWQPTSDRSTVIREGIVAAVEAWLADPGAVQSSGPSQPSWPQRLTG